VAADLAALAQLPLTRRRGRRGAPGAAAAPQLRGFARRREADPGHPGPADRAELLADRRGPRPELRAWPPHRGDVRRGPVRGGSAYLFASVLEQFLGV